MNPRNSLITLAFLMAVHVTAAFAQVAIPAMTRPDFNRDGKDDLAIGIPGENTGAGAVQIIYGGSNGLSELGDQFFSQNSPGVPGGEQNYDGCGTALAAGDFNGDGYADLAFGCPGENTSNTIASGAVIVLYGSRTGLTSSGSQYWSQADPAISGGAEGIDACGQSVATGDINRDGYAELIWGCPGEAIGTRANAGALNVLFGSAGGLTATGNRFLSQDSAGIPDTAEDGDRCGTTVASGDFNGDGFGDVAWGCPKEDIDLLIDAGGVSVAFGYSGGVSGATGGFVNQRTGRGLDQSEGVEAFDLCGEGLASDDFNGDGRADLVFGCPGEDIFPLTFDVGSIHVLYGWPDQIFTFGHVRIPATSRGRCGAAITTGKFNNDQFADIALGCTSANDSAGHVHLYKGGSSVDDGVTFLDTFSQDTFGVPDSNERGDNFGYAVGAGDFDANGFSDLAIGAPDEDLAAGNSVGAVTVIYFPRPPLLEPVRAQLWHQDILGVVDQAEQPDNFGGGLAGSGLTPIAGLTGTWGDDVTAWCQGASCAVSGTFTALNPSRLPTPRVTLRFYVSTDQLLDDGDQLLTTVPVKPLAPSDSQERKLQVTLPQTWYSDLSGRYVIAFVDADDIVEEANEANNVVVSAAID
jgi:hypothetical protein